MKALSFAVAVTLMSAPAFSEAGWKFDMPVNGVQSLADGGFIIYGPIGAGSGCAENGKLFHIRANQMGQTADGVKTSLSLALTAFTTGKTITFTYDNATPSCYVGTVLVNR